MVAEVDGVTAALPAVKTGFDLVRAALGLLKDVQGVLPDGEKKATVAQALAPAERASQIAEAQVAQALGYKLCQCKFPPQIMLSEGRHPDGDEVFRCPTCKKEEPSEQRFANRRNAQRYALGGPDDWMSR